MRCRVCDTLLTKNETSIYDYKLGEYKDTCVQCAGAINRSIQEYDFIDSDINATYVQTPIDDEEDF